MTRFYKITFKDGSRLGAPSKLNLDDAIAYFCKLTGHSPNDIMGEVKTLDYMPDKRRYKR